ncbi:MAG: metallo-mystery pair system four-Cys motif protein [Chloroflexi bacterium]|nr:metallo-mystery pair system four-Cys motif protein [Chloroflexota bacterium]
MKKVYLLFTAVLVALSLAACSGEVAQQVETVATQNADQINAAATEVVAAATANADQINAAATEVVAAATANADQINAAATEVVAAVGATQPVTINFAMNVGDQEAKCGQSYEGLGSSGSPVEINDMRFYISNVRLVNSNGEETPLTLEQDGLWQVEGVALLDFEDATAGCADTGTPELNTSIRGSVPEQAFVCPECEPTGILFDLGVPFALNHLDVTVAPSPLNIPAMWWNWQGGYKFVRIDLKTDAEATEGAWFIHLGSTSCQAPDKNTPPTEPCARPNLASVRLDNFDVTQNVIVADVASLLADVNLSESTPQPAGCMSGPDDPDCAALFPVGFGLDIAAGACLEEGCPAQRFFRIE